MKHTITCIGFKRYTKNSLVGFADITIGELKLTIRNIALHERNGARWVSPPGTACVRNGQLVTDDAGKVQYAQILEFADRGARDAFSQAIWRAVEAFDPEAVAP